MAGTNSTQLHRNVKDISGIRFGRLVVIEYVGKEQWRCQCDCGSTKLVMSGHLRRGHTKSCGCIAKTPKTDLTGTRVGLLTVVRLYEHVGHPRWLCRCDCGGESIITDYTLRQGTTKSCGCLSSTRTIGDRLRTHGRTESSEYKVWCGIKRRCLNENEKAYAHYGGRGIQICDRWKHSFEAFLEDMGERPSSKHEIDRKNNNGNYEPGNCRWLLKAKQALNRRSSHLVTYNGQTHCLMEWQRITGIGWGTISYRLSHGRSVEEALTTPVKRK